MDETLNGAMNAFTQLEAAAARFATVLDGLGRNQGLVQLAKHGEELFYKQSYKNEEFLSEFNEISRNYIASIDGMDNFYDVYRTDAMASADNIIQNNNSVIGDMHLLQNTYMDKGTNNFQKNFQYYGAIGDNDVYLIFNYFDKIIDVITDISIEIESISIIMENYLSIFEEKMQNFIASVEKFCSTMPCLFVESKKNEENIPEKKFLKSLIDIFDILGVAATAVELSSIILPAAPAAAVIIGTLGIVSGIYVLIKEFDDIVEFFEKIMRHDVNAIRYLWDFVKGLANLDFQSALKAFEYYILSKSYSWLSMAEGIVDIFYYLIIDTFWDIINFIGGIFGMNPHTYNRLFRIPSPDDIESQYRKSDSEYSGAKPNNFRTIFNIDENFSYAPIRHTLAEQQAGIAQHFEGLIVLRLEGNTDGVSVSRVSTSNGLQLAVETARGGQLLPGGSA